MTLEEAISLNHQEVACSHLAQLLEVPPQESPRLKGLQRKIGPESPLKAMLIPLLKPGML